MDKKALEAVKRFVEKVDRDFRLEGAFLFGSRARGDHFLHSDVDVLLVSRDFEGVRFTDRMTMMYDYWSYEYPLEVLCYTPSEFDKKKKQIGIVRHAIKWGVRVF